MPFRTIPQRIAPSAPKTGIADRLLAQVQTVSATAVDSETAVQWLQFPDERVACAAIRTFLSLLDDLRVGDSCAWDYLLRRAVREAVEEGMYWTPLLDTVFTECPFAAKDDTPELLPLLHGLRRWAANQLDADDVLPLLTYSYLPVQEICLETDPTPALVGASAWRRPSLLPGIADHSELDATTAHVLARVAAESLIAHLGNSTLPIESTQATVAACSSALTTLDARFVVLESSVLDGLVAAALRLNASGASDECDAVISLLIQMHENATAEQLHVVCPVLRSRRHVRFGISHLLRHPAASMLWHELADLGSAGGQWPDHRVLRALGAHPGAVRDPYVRNVLASSPDEHVQRTVLDLLEPERFAEVIAGLARQGGLKVEDLATASAAQLGALKYKHWRPVLKRYTPGYTDRLLSVIPSARQSRSVRPRLVESKDPTVLATLCREDEVSPLECARLLIQVAHREPALAIELLRRDSLAAALSPAQLLPLLEHKSVEVREAAISALGRGGAKASMTASTRADRSSRRRPSR